MDKKIYMKYGLTAILGIVAFVYWGFFKTELIFFNEYFQMFLFDKQYFIDRITQPGGFGEYLSEFLTQFYYYPKLGALVIAVLLVGFQLVTKKVFDNFNVDESYYPLTFLPALTLWYVMMNENILLTLPISLIISCLTYLLIEKISCSKIIKQVIIFITISLMYWLFGAAIITLVLLICAKHFKEDKILSISYLAYLLIFEWLISRIVMLPVDSFFIGFNYNRYLTINKTYIITFFVTSLLPYLLSLIKKTLKEKLVYLEIGLIVILAIIIIPKGNDFLTLQTIRFYMYTYNHEWDKVIEESDEVYPTNKYGIQCLNLALAEKGQLTNQMFHYFQPGLVGLVSDFQTDMFSPLVCSEVFWELGAVNLSQRYAYESQENIPNYKKSGKCFLRLAETNMLNKQFPIAKKYLEMLTKTLFYKDIAEEYLGMLKDQKAMNGYQKFAEIQKKKLEIDGVEENLNIFNLLTNLLKKNIHNELAIQYIQAVAMIQMDYNALRSTIPALAKSGAKQIPTHVQEALVFFYNEENKTLNNIPSGISQGIIMNFKNKLIDKTYWQYVIFTTQNANKR